MPGPFDYLLWVVSGLFQAAVVVCLARPNLVRRYFTLCLYMFSSLLISVSRFVILQRYGFTSTEYVYFYYYSDGLGTILLFFAVISLYQLVFEEMGAGLYIRGGSIFLLGATTLFSYGVVHQHVAQLTTRFVVELSQNLYFVGVVLTYLLWGAVLKLPQTRTRLIHVVLSLGIYFSASAGAYALRNMLPSLQLTKLIPPLAGTFMPLAWAYTFLRVPEEARLPTARMATPHR